MLIKIINKIPHIYSIQKLQEENSQVSFPQDFNDEILAKYDVYRVKTIDAPNFNHDVENVLESFVINKDGKWVQSWIISPASDLEIASRENDRIQKRTRDRILAYQQESDPIFFKVQRNEAAMDDWLSKVAEIKSRYI